MASYKVFLWSVYRVCLTNRDEPLFVCAPSFISAIKKANRLINDWDDKDKYSIVSVTYVSPCLI